MLALAIALLVIGVIFLFVIPWVGVPIGAVGVALLVIYLLGAARRTADPSRDSETA
jgi:hypothetical protein